MSRTMPVAAEPRANSPRAYLVVRPVRAVPRLKAATGGQQADPARQPRCWGSHDVRLPVWVLCHEHHRSKRRCGTVREMKEGRSGSAIRSLIPSHRKLLWSKVTVVSVAETPGR